MAMETWQKIFVKISVRFMSKERLEDWRWDHGSQVLQEKHKMAYSLFHLISAKSIISLGEGDGFFLNTFPRIPRKVAIDFSDSAILQCTKKGIEAYKVDIEKESLPFKDKDFDCVFLIDVLEHVWQPEILLKEASRVGKHVILTVPNFSFLKDRLQMLCGLVPQSMGHKKGHCFFFNLKEIKQVCQQTGLEIIKLEAYYPLKHKPLLGTISYYIYKLFPNLWATSFAVLLKSSVRNI